MKKRKPNTITPYQVILMLSLRTSRIDDFLGRRYFSKLPKVEKENVVSELNRRQTYYIFRRVGNKIRRYRMWNGLLVPARIR